ncbi:MAG TPA: hypothetical protein VJ953_18390 [Saprospiraceae bacterium]|nr:hypothetical protein [Saprospiraceae bacterium]
MTARTTLQPVAAYRINLAASYRRLEVRIAAHNIRVDDVSQKIKATHHCLAKEIIRLYKQTFHCWQASCLGAIKGMQLPTQKLNNALLGRIMTCTGRTIQNYRKRLQGLGLIAKTHWHGSNKPYFIEIAPSFLVFEARNEHGQWQNFPLTSTCTSTSTLTSTSTGTKLEENSSNAKESGLEPELPRPEPKVEMKPEPTPLPRPEQQPELMDRNENGGQQSCQNTQEPEQNDGNEPGEQEEVAWRYAAQLWTEARRRLWPRKYFSPENEERVRRMIQKMFLLAPMDRYGRYFEIWLFRIGLAMLHWEREFGEKIPDPVVFFDLDNPNGFAITRNWPNDPDRYPVQKPNYKLRRRVATQRAGRKGDTIRLGNLFQ